MITHLHIQNVALIDKAEVAFGPGLNVLSGETGAGKSMLIDAINFMLGHRPGRDFIRAGQETASVEGVVTVTDPEALAALKDLDIPTEDGELLLSRTLNQQGRSVCRINGRTLTVSLLKDVSAFLVDVHGQHQHQSLLNPHRHIVLLDNFCGAPLAQLKAELAGLIADYRHTAKKLKELQGNPGQRETQLEIWRFQLQELAAAKLKPGEEEALSQRRNRLSDADKLAQYTSESLFLLYGAETSVTSHLGRAQTLLQNLAAMDETQVRLSGALTEISHQIADMVSELREYHHGLNSDPQTLEKLESRLDTLYRLRKKYGGTTEDLLAQQEKLQAQIDEAENSGARIAELNAQRRQHIQLIAAKCNEMTALRRKQAEAIQSKIVGALRELGMKHVQFAVAMEKQATFTANGNDRLEFMLSPNLGEAMRPLAKIASGGEMSRVMLAMKAVMAHADGIGTLIFDEIDTGVSGRTAQQVAEKLVSISRSHQILCITHLPQIAAMADHHFLIAKNTMDVDGQPKTRTCVTPLSQQDIFHELARLIGGAQITDATLQAAEEMKHLAEELKS